MKLFRRALYVVLNLSILTTMIEIGFSVRGRDPPVSAGWIFVLALFGLQLWCAVFLKVEPTLARIGRMAFLVALVLFVKWADNPSPY